jgi:hypothetical protein
VDQAGNGGGTGDIPPVEGVAEGAVGVGDTAMVVAAPAVGRSAGAETTEAGAAGRGGKFNRIVSFLGVSPATSLGSTVTTGRVARRGVTDSTGGFSAICSF